MTDDDEGLGFHGPRARDREAAAIERVRRIVEVYFRPWGAAKGEEWEDLSGDKPFDPTTALRLIESAIRE